MRPIQLTMTAFGPYKHKEVVDFTELQDHSLFVIAGNTGAGKTTIFDAICFALYGSASGQDRDHHSMLRSHFADPSVHTAVELIFTIHNRIYRILRQLAHIKPGNKTPTGEKYEFFEIVHGTEIPVVERQIVSEINKKVEDLIGLTENQFKQIVMLPQGEFLKLLTSETQNKEAILRRLFKTDHYQQLNELLRERKNSAEANYKEAEQACKQHIAYIQATIPERDESELFLTLNSEHYNEQQVIEGLSLEGKYYLEKSEADEKAYRQENATYEKMQKFLYEARALNEKFTELETKKKLLFQLEQEKPNIKQLEETLTFAKRAQQIKPYEEQFVRIKETKETQTKIVEQLTKNVKKAQDQLERVEEAYHREKAQEPQRIEIRKNLERLKEFLPFVKNLHEKRADVIQRRKKVNSLSKEIEELELEVKKQQREKQNMIDKIRQLEKDVDHISTTQQQLTNVKEKLTIVESYLLTYKNYESAKTKVTKKRFLYEEAKDQYNKREKVWLSNQAYHIALHLHDGEPCPVCGSKDHPQSAVATDEEITRDEWMQAKTQVDSAQAEYNQALALLTTYKQQYEEAQIQLSKCEIKQDDVEGKKEQLIEQRDQLTKTIDELSDKQKDLQQKREEEEKVDQSLNELQDQLEKKRINYSEQHTKLTEKEAVLFNEISRVPEDVRELKKLQEQILNTEKTLNKLIKTYEKVEKSFYDAQAQVTKLTTELNMAKKRLAEVEEEAKASEQKLHQVLEKQQFSTVEQYRSAIIDEQEQTRLKEKITQFQKTLQLTVEQIKQLNEQLEGKERVDLKALEHRVTNLKQKAENAFKTWQQTKSLHKETIRLKDSFEKAIERISQYEHQLNIVADLYNVARGQNEHRLSFERFLQIEYLEQIIDAANHRLQHLSNGQFWLRRSERQESHGRQSGLAFDVFDEYTGKVRDVKTLSGGEKFNASLCLALGMSDVIQSFQGNIAIETMFIDEGFGTLDEETLNKSIETLIDLQASGRMIGVISHVQALKTIFPAILEVTKTKAGYSQTKFIVN